MGVEEIPVSSRGVSDRRVASPGPVFTSDGRIRKQPCGRYDSNPSCLYLALRHSPLQHFRSPRGRATPWGSARNINSILRLLRLRHSRTVSVTWAAIFVLLRKVAGELFGYQSERLRSGELVCLEQWLTSWIIQMHKMLKHILFETRYNPGLLCHDCQCVFLVNLNIVAPRCKTSHVRKHGVCESFPKRQQVSDQSRCHTYCIIVRSAPLGTFSFRFHTCMVFLIFKGNINLLARGLNGICYIFHLKAAILKHLVNTDFKEGLCRWY